jgi:cytochrome c-type biogenesis protein CcmH/NrfG
VRLLLRAAQEAQDDETFLQTAKRLRESGTQDRSLLMAEARVRHKYEDSAVATSILESWLRTFSEDAEAWMLLGNIAVDTGDGERALECMAHSPEPHCVNAQLLELTLRLAIRANSTWDRKTQRYLYQVWRHNRRDPRAWQGLQTYAFFFHKHETESAEVPQCVAPGVTAIIDVG